MQTSLCGSLSAPRIVLPFLDGLTAR